MPNYGLIENEAVLGAGERIVPQGGTYSEAVGLGRRIPSGLRGEAVLQATETDWTVGLEPIFTQTAQVPNTYAVVRKDTGVPFGNGRCVGKGYRPYQNHELVSFAEALVDAADGAMEFEAGGFFRGGATVWYQARIPHAVEIRTTELGLDKIEPYLFLLSAHDGTGSTVAHFMGGRIFCANQFPGILADARVAKNSVAVRHTRNMGERMKEAQMVMRQALGFFETHVLEMRELDSHAMTLAQMRSFAEELIGETQVALSEAEQTISKATQNRRVAQIDRLVDLFGNGHGNVGRTRFDALQAVGELEDHHKPVSNDASRIRRLIAQPAATDLKVRAHRLLAR